MGRRRRLTIVLDERIKRTEHVPKPGERYGPKWDYVPAGELRLKIDEWVGGNARKTWSDGVRPRLEGQLNSVIIGLVVVAGAKRAWDATVPPRTVSAGHSKKHGPPSSESDTVLA